MISDLRITLLSGKAHLKHTEGGDFREAVYRAIRQGLRRGKSVLLEPYGSFRLEVNEESLSRVIYEIERIDGQFQLQASDLGMSVLSGSAPLAGLQKLARELPSHTRGRGRLYHTFDRYLPCRHAQDVLEARAYDCDRDVQEPCGSIFCAQGAGFYVPWDEVENYMHLPYAYVPEPEAPSPRPHVDARSSSRSTAASDEELEAIFARTYGTKKKKVSDRESYARHEQQRASAQTRLLPECLLVDGYNIIHDWEELQTIAASDLAAARHRLIDLMCSYQGYRRCTLILVFDAYQVKDQGTTMQQVDNIYVVYTKTAQTADSYIEQATHRLAEEYRVSVATSDGLEQLIAIGQGAMRISARGLREELIRLRAQGEKRHPPIEAAAAAAGRAAKLGKRGFLNL
ncbi:MAG: NYN domain-containing protein [Merdibacter sp.]